MDAMEEKIGSILNNPEMMRQIMTMAQSLNPTASVQEPAKEKPAAQPEMDLGMIKKFSGLARQSNIDKDQQALLKALSPYLSRARLHKLENAMRAAKMARIAASALGTQGNLFSSAR